MAERVVTCPRERPTIDNLDGLTDSVGAQRSASRRVGSGRVDECGGHDAHPGAAFTSVTPRKRWDPLECPPG